MIPRVLKYNNTYYLIADNATMTFASGNTEVIDIDRMIFEDKENMDIRALHIAKTKEKLEIAKLEVLDLIHNFNTTKYTGIKKLLFRLSIIRRINKWKENLLKL